jgi:hypothetical protein
MYRRGANFAPYIEGHDFFQSHGSYEVQLKQTYQLPSNQLQPKWAETRTDGVVTESLLQTQLVASDLSNPSSIINLLLAFVATVRAHLMANALTNPGMGNPGYAEYVAFNIAVNACDSLTATLSSGTIPPPFIVVNPGQLIITGDYSTIVYGGQASGIPAPPGFTGWVGDNGIPPNATYVDEHFGALLPAYLFGVATDISLWQQGDLRYPANASSASLLVSNIIGNTAAAQYEEWTLICEDTFLNRWQVRGSSSGFIGTFIAGSAFSSSSISFNTTVIGAPSTNEKVVLTPVNPITMHRDAPLEWWNIIKVNPLAYSRPAFSSTAYARIVDANGNFGRVTVLDLTLPNGTITLTATSATTFALASLIEPSYTANVQVNVPFNDGRLAFTIIPPISGTIVPGDQFVLEIINRPPSAAQFDLYYGYDLDSYDNPDLVYNNNVIAHPDFGRRINFRYDTRFTDYDLSSFNLNVTQAAVNGRKFRLVAIPDQLQPISTIKKDGSGPTHSVDLEAEDQELPPVLGIGNPPVFSMPGDSNPAVDLQLFYANNFRLEYSDDNFNTTTVVTTVPVGSTFSDAGLGISFTLASGSMPFIGASSDNGVGMPRVEGGDMFAFTVDNPPPELVLTPIPLIGSSVPRLIMHGDSFHWSVAADWALTFTSPTTWSLNALYSEGPLTGTPVPGYPVTGSFATTGIVLNEGLSYRDDNVHFTIVPGRGFRTGDTFTFTTFNRKPSFLVHGSFSGYTQPAAYDEWYWNGKIGFKLNSARLRLFDAGGPVLQTLGIFGFGSGTVEQVRLRPDAPSIKYTFTRGARWQVTRSDKGVMASVPLNGTYSDEYLVLNINDPGIDFTISIHATQFDFWNCQDSVIVKSNISSFNPEPTDTLVIKKAQLSDINLNLNYSTVASPPSLAPLGPRAISLLHSDTNSLIAATSPETTIQNNWIPLVLERMDSSTSIAHFTDATTRWQLKTAATNELVATVSSLSSTPLPGQNPTRVDWDTNFFANYMPLNTRATLVAFGTYLNEIINVRMSERFNVFTGGDALLENALFNDDITINLNEALNWDLQMTQSDEVNAQIADGPFGGFLAGFSNLPYDAEDALALDIASLSAAQGQYDTGAPLVDHYLRAQFLASLLTPTPAQITELSTLTALIYPYLQPGGLAATSLIQFMAALDADPYAIGGTPPQMGYPVVGHAFDIDSRATAIATTSITEAMTVLSVDDGDELDDELLDDLPLDALPDITIIVFSGSLPPTILATGGQIAARVFEISFISAPISTPSFTLLLPDPNDPNVPIPLPIAPVSVQQLSPRVFKFSIPQPLIADISVN